MADWIPEFYARQDALIKVYSGPVTAQHREKAMLILELAGQPPLRLLELGAGGGQVAAATAELGYDVVALELVPGAARNGQELARQVQGGRLTVHQADFYTYEVSGTFDIVCYWDGFGVGTDAEQRQLLKRIAGWLSPGGQVLLDINTPWHWARAAGEEMTFGTVRRRYGYDAAENRMLDSWWRVGEEDQIVTQSLRCYTPVDLQLLLEGTGLTLAKVISGAGMNYATMKYEKKVPLGQDFQYLACLVADRSGNIGAQMVK